MSTNALTAAAMAFWEAQPWTVYPANALFAVRYPDGGTGYCCIMGGAGEPAMLMLYMGESGLSSYYRLRTLPAGAPRYRVHETMVRQECLVCTFPEGDVPVFRKRQPYKVPVTIDDPLDAAHLQSALMAACTLAERIQTITAELTDRQTIPLLILQPSPDEPFALSIMQLPEDSRIIVDSPILDEEAAEAMRQVETNPKQELLCELVISPKTVAGHPPMYPVGLLMADPQEGIVGMPVVHDYDAGHDELVAALLSFCLEHGKPFRLRVRDDSTFLLLQNTTNQIGLSLELDPDLPMIDELKQSFFDSIPE